MSELGVLARSLAIAKARPRKKASGDPFIRPCRMGTKFGNRSLLDSINKSWTVGRFANGSQVAWSDRGTLSRICLPINRRSDLECVSTFDAANCASDFEGKFIAATNRELELEIQSGHFREDLYYRLCADRIQTPTLREQLVDRPEDLLELTRFIAARLLRQVKDEVDALASESVDWIEQNIGSDYAWPGNIRELEQCVRNVLIRKSYLPANRNMGSSVTVGNSTKDAGSNGHFVKALLAGELTLGEVTARSPHMKSASFVSITLLAKLPRTRTVAWSVPGSIACESKPCLGIDLDTQTALISAPAC